MLDKWIASLRKGNCIPENDLRQLCIMVNKYEKLFKSYLQTKDILIEEPNVRLVPSPVTICGDIHGQFYDLLELFKTGGEMPFSNYVFMGDYVDRGYNSVETFQLLMCYKVKYPECITLIRGNHDDFLKDWEDFIMGNFKIVEEYELISNNKKFLIISN